MTPLLTKEMVMQIESLLKHGSRVEILIEQGKVVIVEIKRKMRMKEQHQDRGLGESNGTVSVITHSPFYFCHEERDTFKIYFSV